MKVGCFLLVLCVVFGTVVAANKKGKLKKVTEFMPEECTRTAENGDVVEVHYTGTLEDGTVFDSSRTEGRDPIRFPLGSNQVIQGWDQGIQGMCVGEKRTLTIPSHLGYGEKGSGPIPGGATLIFETELLSVQKESVISSFNIQKWIPFFGIPLIIAYVVYQLWTKAANAPTAKERKESKRKSKRK